MKVERTIDIDAARERVWETLMDPQCLDDWVSIHKKLVDAPDGELRKGSELTQCLHLAGKNFNVDWKVEEADKPNRAVWAGKGPMRSKAGVVYELEDNGDGKTRFHYMNEFKSPGGPFGAVIDRITGGTAERQADKTLANLKNLLEKR
jgi:carbon monoxide dehydrogenase subunit G